MPNEGPNEPSVYHYRWTDCHGGVNKLRMSDCTADEAAVHAAACGWTPPRWWEFWRRNDYPRVAFDNANKEDL